MPPSSRRWVAAATAVTLISVVVWTLASASLDPRATILSSLSSALAIPALVFAATGPSTRLRLWLGLQPADMRALLLELEEERSNSYFRAALPEEDWMPAPLKIEPAEALGEMDAAPTMEMLVSHITKHPTSLFVWGEAGTGKTFLLHQIHQALHERAHREQTAPAPFMVSASDISGGAHGIHDALVRILSHRLRLPHSLFKKRFPKIIVIIDGIDEVPQLEASNFIEQIKNYMFLYPGQCVLMSGRSLLDLAVPNLHVLAATERDVKDTLERAGHGWSSTAEHLHTIPPLYDVLSKPLFMHIARRTFGATGPGNRLLEAARESEAALRALLWNQWERAIDRRAGKPIVAMVGALSRGADRQLLAEVEPANLGFPAGRVILSFLRAAPAFLVATILGPFGPIVIVLSQGSGLEHSYSNITTRVPPKLLFTGLCILVLTPFPLTFLDAVTFDQLFWANLLLAVVVTTLVGIMGTPVPRPVADSRRRWIRQHPATMGLILGISTFVAAIVISVVLQWILILAGWSSPNSARIGLVLGVSFAWVAAFAAGADFSLFHGMARVAHVLRFHCDIGTMMALGASSGLLRRSGAGFRVFHRELSDRFRSQPGKHVDWSNSSNHDVAASVKLFAGDGDWRSAAAASRASGQVGSVHDLVDALESLTAAERFREAEQGHLEAFLELKEEASPELLWSWAKFRALSSPEGNSNIGELSFTKDVLDMASIVDSSDPWNMLLYASWLIQHSHDFAVAVRILTDLQESYPSWSNPVSLRAVAYWWMGRIDDADKEIRRASELAPDDISTRLRHAMFSAELCIDDPGRIGETQELLESAMKADGESRWATALYASWLADMGELGQATDVIDVLIDESPNSSEWWARRADYLWRSNRQTKALKASRKAMELSPNDAGLAWSYACFRASSRPMKDTGTRSTRRTWEAFHRAQSLGPWLAAPTHVRFDSSSSSAAGDLESMVTKAILDSFPSTVEAIRDISKGSPEYTGCVSRVALTFDPASHLDVQSLWVRSHLLAQSESSEDSARIRWWGLNLSPWIVARTARITNDFEYSFEYPWFLWEYHRQFDTTGVIAAYWCHRCYILVPPQDRERELMSMYGLTASD